MINKSLDMNQSEIGLKKTPQNSKSHNRFRLFTGSTVFASSFDDILGAAVGTFWDVDAALFEANDGDAFDVLGTGFLGADIGNG